ncbi:Uncharacterized protein FWK35_00017883, partial [Aphis craccivora]
AICLEDRCPEVLWLLSNPWRLEQKECNKIFENSSKNNTSSLYEKTKNPQMYDNSIKSETKREKKQLATTTSTPNYGTVPFTMFEKYKNRSKIETNDVKLVLKKCIETPTVHKPQKCMAVTVFVLLLYLVLLLFSWTILISYREEIILQKNINNQ